MTEKEIAKIKAQFAKKVVKDLVSVGPHFDFLFLHEWFNDDEGYPYLFIGMRSLYTAELEMLVSKYEVSVFSRSIDVDGILTTVLSVLVEPKNRKE